MNNLLRTLTESQVKSVYPDSDLKLLLTTVKESRRQSYDTKVSASDPFYDSLEGLLNDLKTVTIDNHDAEPFLKPVSKAEAQDYYDVISNPMDFGTMLKKVKTKQYKSKREFKDDLELIWSNCLTYNAAESHPLRPCVKRLKLKADRLLKYLTDRKERVDPPIPTDITATHIARPKLNGSALSNGYSHSHHRSSSVSTISKSTTPTLKSSPSISAKPIPQRDAPFPDTPAITRTPQGMTMFSRLDREIGQCFESSSSRKPNDTPSLLEKLHELAAPIELPPSGPSSPQTPSSDNVMAVDDSSGDKRKINGCVDSRPRKRQRFSSQYATPLVFEEDNLSELWWGAVQSDSLLSNGLPHIAFASSSSRSYSPSPNATASSSTSSPSVSRKNKPKRRKILLPPENTPKSLLALMNNNIKTMKRLRHTHSRFSALNLNNNANTEDPEGGILGEGVPFAGGGGGGGGVMRGATPTLIAGEEDGMEAVDDKVDERPWISMMKEKRQVKGSQIGEESAMDCARWMTGKTLEHAGFQGSSKIALDVLAGVTSEYLLNVGRTIRYLCDKHSNVMTPEEIILHTLFESGTSKIQDLERYISDDVERYGTRLLDLEKKLVSAYKEHTTVEVLDDEGLFEDEDEEEAGALAIGDFADALGEDYLGLRELGIAAEFGMSSLSIPKKLLRNKKAQKFASAAAKPTEPPPPYPPPPPFIPLTAAKVEDQIGLLKSYYNDRFAALATKLQVLPPPTLPILSGPILPGPKRTPPTIDQNPPIPSLTPPALPTYNMPPYPPVAQDVKPPMRTPSPPAPAPPPPTLALPDDQPSATQIKMGPLGQILKGGSAGAGGKKKKAGAPSGAGGVGTDVGVSPLKKKKTGMVGVGTGNGRKKKTEEGGPGPTTPVGTAGTPGQLMPPPQQQMNIHPHPHPHSYPYVQHPTAYGLPSAMAAYALPPMPVQPQPPIIGQ